jgi:hypothetical protein
MIESIYENLVSHFSAHDGLADVIIGPEREDWFNAEAIAAIGKAHHDWWVYGEMTYSHWAELLHLDPTVIAGCENREPDLFCAERKTDVMALLGEAKLVRRPTDAAPFGAGAKGLLAQLNRARKFTTRLQACNVACPRVCGLIYGLYNPANMFPGVGEEDPDYPGLSMNTEFETGSPVSFFKSIHKKWANQAGAKEWRLWRGGMQLPPSLQNLSPKYSNIASNLCVGIGIALHRTDVELQPSA